MLYNVAQEILSILSCQKCEHMRDFFISPGHSLVFSGMSDNDALQLSAREYVCVTNVRIYSSTTRQEILSGATSPTSSLLFIAVNLVEMYHVPLSTCT